MMEISNISSSKIPSKFRFFSTSVDAIALPEKFTFPFAYTPHQLSKIAAKELQEYLETQSDFEFNFNDDSDNNFQAVGKMFGVLVVKHFNGNLGYLAAYSGKLANSNHISFFVPPVFDMLTEDGFFLKEEQMLNQLNEQITNISKDTRLTKIKSILEQNKNDFEIQYQEFKCLHKQRKKKRDSLRRQLLADKNKIDKYTEQDLIKQSLRDKHEMNVLKNTYKEKEKVCSEEIQYFEQIIERLKSERKEKSALLQQKLFQSYQFLNRKGGIKDLLQIFDAYNSTHPPAGAGECCAPKLLQYAYLHRLEPIAMAEFWWGASPVSEIRKHKNFYPSCWGKCHPILSHMLEGLQVDENPLLINQGAATQIEIIYEDDVLIILNKPADLLSVPGIHIQDSVYTRLQALYPNQMHPYMVHRLDMGTSGLMVVAKSKKIHKLLQAQFIKRKVEKRYTAILSGTVTAKKGKIELPLRVDLDDRPRQMVCDIYGKHAETFYDVQEMKDGKTLIHFYPKTGRTHQLRVHAAHQLGLDAPILGDDLYGTSDKRLHLHAEELSFYHPITRKWTTFFVKADFGL